MAFIYRFIFTISYYQGNKIKWPLEASGCYIQVVFIASSTVFTCEVPKDGVLWRPEAAGYPWEELCRAGGVL